MNIQGPNTVDLIINADDLGSSHAANHATFDLISKGLVTSATLMANAPCVEEACQRAAEFPGCSFGVHLNVTEYRPLTDSGDLGLILNGEGYFEGDIIRHVPIDSTLAQGIYQEFCAQIERLDSLGVKVGHIDSHEHIHTIPRLFPILKKVQRRFNIRQVRISRNIYADHEGYTKQLRLKKAAYNFLLKYYYHTKTTDGFTDFPTFCGYGASKRIKHQRVEVMVHPAHTRYVDEEDLLRGPWREQLVFPVRLTSYDDL